MIARDQILLISHTNRKTGQIILVLRHKPRMFCRLTTDQRRSCLFAAFRHAFYDRRDLLRIILATGYVIKEKQRFSARTCHIVDTHCHTVDSDRIMPVHQERQLDLGSHSVRSRQKHGFLHLLDRFQGKSA